MSKSRLAATVGALIALAAIVVLIGQALSFDAWQWLAAGIAAGLLVTLIDREAFYGPRKPHTH